MYDGGIFVELEVEAEGDTDDLAKLLGDFFGLYHQAYAALGFTVEGG